MSFNCITWIIMKKISSSATTSTAASTTTTNSKVILHRGSTTIVLYTFSQCSIRLNEMVESGASCLIFPLTPLTAIRILFSTLNRNLVLM